MPRSKTLMSNTRVEREEMKEETHNIEDEKQYKEDKLDEDDREKDEAIEQLE